MIVLNSSKHSWPFPDHQDTPGIMRDHHEFFYDINRVNKDSPWFVDPWWIVVKQGDSVTGA